MIKDDKGRTETLERIVGYLLGVAVERSIKY
jgi:hypothetical protein